MPGAVEAVASAFPASGVGFRDGSGGSNVAILPRFGNVGSGGFFTLWVIVFFGGLAPTCLPSPRREKALRTRQRSRA